MSAAGHTGAHLQAPAPLRPLQAPAPRRHEPTRHRRRRHVAPTLPLPPPCRRRCRLPPHGCSAPPGRLPGHQSGEGRPASRQSAVRLHWRLWRRACGDRPPKVWAVGRHTGLDAGPRVGSRQV
eukprot:362638-Chlamydomonas_euryale.AAC.5